MPKKVNKTNDILEIPEVRKANNIQILQSFVQVINIFTLKNIFLTFFGLFVLTFMSASGLVTYMIYQRLVKIENIISPKPKLSVNELPNIAKKIGLNVNQFKSCLNSGETAAEVGNQMQSGAKAGVAGTPGAILQDLATGRAVRINGGALPKDTLKQIISDFLTSKPNDLLSDLKDYDPVANADNIRGDKSKAKFALIEYSDLQCPYCIAWHPTVTQVLKESNGDMIWVYRHYPLPARIHPNAEKYAEATQCAEKQGGNDAFWKMVDAIFSAQQ